MNGSKAARFAAQQAKGRFLRLPNAWDSGSARFLASLGAPAIATSSAALAWAHGHADGERLPFEDLLRSVAEITRIVDVPVSVDAESGFGAEAAAVAEGVARLIGAGAAGINIEDRNGPPDILAGRIEAIRRVADREGAELFVNARADLWLRPLVAPGERVAEAIRRGRAYAAAGAGAFFLPGLASAAEAREIAAAVELPLNLMAVPGLPDEAALREAGVTRLSLGVMTLLKAFGALREPVRGFLDGEGVAAFFEGAPSFAEVDGLFG